MKRAELIARLEETRELAMDPESLPAQYIAEAVRELKADAEEIRTLKAVINRCKENETALYRKLGKMGR